MAASLFSLARRMRKTLAIFREAKIDATFVNVARLYCTKRASRQTLQSMIWPLGDPTISIMPELDRWVNKGNRVRPVEMKNIIKDLRKRRRYRQALEVSEWMKNKNFVSFQSGDHAVHLDLIGEVHGVDSAESYFNSMENKDKNEKTYGALLNCYVRKRLTEKALAHMNKMKEMGLLFSALPYNCIMGLYANIEQHDKIPSVLAEMKAHGVLPDNFSYRICINAYGTLSDIDGMEMVLEEMEHQPQIVVDWNTYSVVANMYIKAELPDKAFTALAKAEQKLEKGNAIGYNHLISLYGYLGSKSDIWRIWKLQKEHCKKFINRDYTTMLGALIKLGEINEAEALVKEWESSGNSLDWRVPNTLLVGYRQKGLLEKAEAMLDDFLSKGKSPGSSSWGIVSRGFWEAGKIDKAYELMKNALYVYVQKSGWEPNGPMIKSILQYLGDQGEIKDVETFIELLNIVMPVDREMYHALIKANIRAGNKVDELLQKMKANGVEENEETREILDSRTKTKPSDL